MDLGELGNYMIENYDAERRPKPRLIECTVFDLRSIIIGIMVDRLHVNRYIAN